MSGKGSSPRPFSVDQQTFSNNWDAIFGKKKSMDKKDLDTYNDERLVSSYDKKHINDIVGDSNATSDNNRQR
jgi:hypothetical protein